MILATVSIMSLETRNNRLIFSILLVVILMILSLIVVSLINPDNLYWGLFLTTGQLIATIILIRYLSLSKQDLGLTYHRSNMFMHVITILVLIFIVLIVKYFVEGVQSINNISFEVIYFFLFYSVVAITEELYFRGVLYHVLESWSPLVALIGSSIIFGLFHVRSGLTVVFIMTFTGLSFAVVRYMSNMIYLLIPFHLLFNFQSVLFIFNDSTDISGVLYLGLSILMVVIFILIKSKKKDAIEQ
jgi:membrane protease YdiL (CAAX protease family)